MVAQEFQAVVLAAGRGSRMMELTQNRPKCLLPVGQHPIIYHALKLLEKAGFREAIVVVLNSTQSQVQNALSRCELSISTELIGIPSDEDWGTAESLRYLFTQERISSDVVVLSCDLFTNGHLGELLLRFRQYDASVASLFFNPLDQAVLSEQPPGVKSKNKPEKDIIGIDEETSRLVFLASASDFEEIVPIKRAILRRHPNLSLRTDLVDGHVYVISLKLIKYLAACTSLSTIKGEFLPYVVGKQHKRLNPEGDEKQKLLFESMKEDSMEELIREVSSFNDHRGGLKGVYHGDSLRCFAVLAKPNHFGIRLNSVSGLWQANRLVTSSQETTLNTGERVDPSSEVLSNQVEESFIGPNSKVSEKTSIRGSVLGDATIVHPKTRVTRCIVLKKVDIKEGCVLENCIIGNDVVIGEKCELKNCVVGGNHVVPPGTKSSFQVLTETDSLMEI